MTLHIQAILFPWLNSGQASKHSTCSKSFDSFAIASRYPGAHCRLCFALGKRATQRLMSYCKINLSKILSKHGACDDLCTNKSCVHGCLDNTLCASIPLTRVCICYPCLPLHYRWCCFSCWSMVCFFAFLQMMLTQKSHFGSDLLCFPLRDFAYLGSLAHFHDHLSELSSGGNRPAFPSMPFSRPTHTFLVHPICSSWDITLLRCMIPGLLVVLH